MLTKLVCPDCRVEIVQSAPGWKCLKCVDGILGKKFIVREALHLLMEPLAILDDSLTSIDHGCGMLVVFEK